MLSCALEYLARGWSVFPLKDKRTPHVAWKEFQDRLPTEQEVTLWWTAWPDAWIAVALGDVSNLARIDADGPDNGKAAIEELNRLGGLPPTLEFTSPSGGRGWLLQNKFLMYHILWDGPHNHEELRVQSHGNYTVVPPSPGYTWTNDLPVAEAPQWLKDEVIASQLVKLAKDYQVVDHTIRELDEEELLSALEFIPPDSYEVWRDVGFALHTIDRLDLWIAWSKKNPDKFHEGECEQKWAKFTKDRTNGITSRRIHWLAAINGWRNLNKHEQLTDLGNAKVLSRIGDGKILHSSELSWLAWDGRRWLQGGDAEKVVNTLQKEVLEYRHKKASVSLNKLTLAGTVDEEAKKRAKAKLKFIFSLNNHESASRFRSVMYLAQSEKNLSCDYRKFNTQHMKLNCNNGTLDLLTQTLHQHNPDDLITQVTRTDYDDRAACPRWEQFLAEVFNNDAELMDWFQRLLGYCLTGSTDLHILPVLWGSGRNGKSTIVRTMINVLGHDYASTTPSGFLAVSRGEQHPTKIATLYGKRFVCDLETGDGMRLDEELVKRLTGGDELMARRMHEDFWYFRPTHKIFLATNYEPTVQGTDDAIWGRVLKIPFTQSFLGREEPGLDDKLAAEAPGILRWLVEGCARWQKDGLKPLPTAVTTATAEYRSEQNSVVRFFTERLVADPQSDTTKPGVMAAYSVWCIQNKQKQLTNTAFGLELRKHFPKLQADKRVYKGIKLV